MAEMLELAKNLADSYHETRKKVIEDTFEKSVEKDKSKDRVINLEDDEEEDADEQQDEAAGKLLVTLIFENWRFLFLHFSKNV